MSKRLPGTPAAPGATLTCTQVLTLVQTCVHTDSEQGSANRTFPDDPSARGPELWARQPRFAEDRGQDWRMSQRENEAGTHRVSEQAQGTPPAPAATGRTQLKPWLNGGADFSKSRMSKKCMNKNAISLQLSRTVSPGSD